MRLAVIAFLLAVGLTGCGPANQESTGRPLPPMAERIEDLVPSSFGRRTDPYSWLRDDRRAAPAVLAYLESENRYTDVMMAPLAGTMAQLREEFLVWTPDAFETLAVPEGRYRYFTRYPTAAGHPVHVRRAVGDGSAEEVLVDGNRRAAPHSFFAFGGFDVSPDGIRLAWLEDHEGRGQYRLFTRVMPQGTVVETPYRGVSSVSWAADGTSLLLVENHPVTLRPCRVWQHWPDERRPDRIVHEENDPAFRAQVGRTRSGRFSYIALNSARQSEMRIVEEDGDTVTSRPLLERSDGHRYAADHVGHHWVIRSNRDAPNFRILRVADPARSEPGRWTELVPERPDVFIEGFAPFERFIVVEERVDGLQRLRIIEPGGRPDQQISFDAPAATLRLGLNLDPSAPSFRYTRTSMTRPWETVERDLRTGAEQVIGRQPVPDGFRPEDYLTWRMHVTVRDGARIPVTLARHRETPLDGSAPLVQRGYGAYGITLDPVFDGPGLSLLDRGFIEAIAHVRGSRSLGAEGHAQGRQLNKINTFHDFIDVTRELVSRRFADPERVYAVGSSAGGLLVGAVANLAPEDYDAVVAHVPFVDVLTAMLDPALPLTSTEIDEWGDPRLPQFRDSISRYSPYENVVSQDYPAMLVTTALHDTRVPYWHAAKWVARLRVRRTDDRPMLLHVDMEGGHIGRAGRFGRLDRRVLETAFLLDQAR